MADSYKYSNKTKRAPIGTLSIHSLSALTDDQSLCVYELQTLLKVYRNTFTDNDINRTLCITLENGCFLICDHRSKSDELLIFVDQNRKISFDVDISVFDNEIIRFKQYYMRNKGTMPSPEICIKYAEDLIVINKDKKVFREGYIEEAYELYNELQQEDNDIIIPTIGL